MLSRPHTAGEAQRSFNARQTPPLAYKQEVTFQTSTTSDESLYILHLFLINYLKNIISAVQLYLKATCQPTQLVGYHNVILVVFMPMILCLCLL